METFRLWTALVTPMNDYAEIDYDSLELLLKEQEAAGNGVLVLGSTGEGLNLTNDEKREIVRFTKSLDLVVPLMAGLGGFNLEQQLDFIRFCESQDVDAFLMVTPLYAKPGLEGQYIWFRSLMNETGKPCMIYNVPSRTGIKMNPEVPARLYKEFPNYMGIKEASGSIDDFKAFRDAAPHAKLYCGDDNLIKEFVEEGAVGHVSVASNAWPRQTRKYVDLAIEGEVAGLFEKWVQCADLFFDAPSPTPVKSLLFHKGWINSDQVRLPLSKLDLSEQTEEALIEADRQVNEWFE
ncbi:MAG: 4-hydroxy-tetrahydrodipicolinate synthase [Balneolales bacterium]|nr:4-hydroxy-tetrahydrodipicolinate synthase [Balneolales bacterium]